MDSYMLEHFCDRTLQVAPAHREVMAVRICAAARAAHEARRLLAELGGQHEWKPWDVTEARMRRDGFIEVMEVLAGEVDQDPAASHRRWMSNKRGQGWVLGPEKDETLKTHPCLVPYDALPPVERAKDYMGVCVICAVLGLTIPRTYLEPLWEDTGQLSACSPPVGV